MKKSEINQTNDTTDFDKSYYAFLGSKYIDVIESEMETSNTGNDELLSLNRLDEWFEQYNKISSRNKKSTSIIKVSKIAAIFLAVIACSLYSFTSQAEGFRVKIMNWIIDGNESYTNITVEENLSLLPNTLDENIYYLAYLPEQYKLLSVEKFNSIYIVQYKNEADIITFGQAPNGTDFQIDTENALRNSLKIGNTNILHIHKENNILFWNNEESSFYIISSLEVEELLKCVENVKK